MVAVIVILDFKEGKLDISLSSVSVGKRGHEEEFHSQGLLRLLLSV